MRQEDAKIEPFMETRKGLTTWCFRFGTASLIWRWNMPWHEALRTCSRRTYGEHGYLSSGPLIVEW